MDAMPAWFRTRVIAGRSLFVELLDNGCLIIQPDRNDLTADDASWVNDQGAQTPSAFEGGPPETLSVGAPISLNVTMALTGMESLEVKAIV